MRRPRYTVLIKAGAFLPSVKLIPKRGLSCYLIASRYLTFFLCVQQCGLVAVDKLLPFVDKVLVVYVLVSKCAVHCDKNGTEEMLRVRTVCIQ